MEENYADARLETPDEPCEDCPPVSEINKLLIDVPNDPNGNALTRLITEIMLPTPVHHLLSYTLGPSEDDLKNIIIDYLRAERDADNNPYMEILQDDIIEDLADAIKERTTFINEFKDKLEDLMLEWMNSIPYMEAQ